jgi:hypothetical protein
LTHVYPEYPWKPWLVDKMHKGGWNDINMVTRYVEWLEKQLNIVELEDWYGYTNQHIASFHGYWVIHKYGNVDNIYSRL